MQLPDDEARLALLRHAVDASGEIVFLTDLTGTFTYVNRQFCQVYGYSPDEVIGRATPRILKSHRQPAAFYRHFWTTLHRGDAVRNTYLNRTKQGQLVTIDASTSPIVEGGRPVGYLAIQRDVTAQREVERAAELARVAIDHAPDAVCWFEPGGRLLYVNHMAVRLTGYSRDELVQRYLFDLTGAGTPQWFDEQWHQILRAGTLQFRVDLRRRSGEMVPVEVRVTRVLFGQDAYGCALLRDVSERDRLDAHLLHAQKMEAIGRLAGGVAHDFNNLLTAIAGFAELTLGRVTDAKSLSDLAEIQNAVERAGNLTRQLLAFSRRQPACPEVIDLNDATARAHRMIGRLVGEDVFVDVETAPDLWPVRIDPSQLDQILINLSVNARDAMPKGGVLSFQTANMVCGDSSVTIEHGVPAGEYVRLTVRDTGTGIPPEVQSRILEPFFTTKPPGKGTGLGLSTVYGIVQQAGGFLTVESEVGRGTSVSVWLPKVGSDRPAVVPPTPAPRPNSGDETVLLAEDDPAVRTIAARFLLQGGYRVLEALSVDHAMTLAREHDGPIHLLVTDIVMPVLNGPDLAQRILEWRPAVRVMYVSGYAETLGAGAVEGGRVRLVAKPFSLQELLSAVRETLDAR